ncbi:ubiquitin-conjugating enzyme h [Striga asiatica]|uniref:Ubiquitin-conjugating enzyme h n=1 Tax=Striga asiatica TaxID=4170 RepID=A0A5A7PCV7_STRAF|nr:ubiquitin-conjugating enzyme h [Striga asiatica]
MFRNHIPRYRLLGFRREKNPSSKVPPDETNVSPSLMLSEVFRVSFVAGIVGIKYCEKYAKPEDAGVAADEKSSDEELTEDEVASTDDEIIFANNLLGETI